MKIKSFLCSKKTNPNKANFEYDLAKMGHHEYFEKPLRDLSSQTAVRQLRCSDAFEAELLIEGAVNESISFAE